MRTLLTTAGRADATDIASITKCFADAQTEGMWLDIEHPDADDFKLLEETFKFHPLTIEDIQHVARTLLMPGGTATAQPPTETVD